MVPIIGVGAVVLREGRLLVVRRGREPGRGLWAVPGGRLEPGELIVDAVVRELREETGLDGRATHLCGIAERITPPGPDGPGVHLVIHDWWVVVEGGGEPVAGDDADVAAFASRGELRVLPLVPLLEDFLVEHGVWGLMAP